MNTFSIGDMVRILPGYYLYKFTVVQNDGIVHPSDDGQTGHITEFFEYDSKTWCRVLVGDIVSMSVPLIYLEPFKIETDEAR